MKVIERDAAFLSGFNIMDYSLLLAVEHNINSRRFTEMAGKSIRQKREKALSISGNTMSHKSENLPNKLSMVRTLSAPSTNASSSFLKTRHKFLSSNEDFVYHLSVIDYLQDFNTDKFMEN